MGGLIDFFLHLDKHLADLIQNYGQWTYAILAGIIFAETGFVITPFLPGDSLLFAAGLFSHADRGGLNVFLLILVLSLAAILGDNANYFIGRFFGERLFRNENSRIFKRSHLEKTHAFFERYGAKTLILARFVPIVRTFTPFVAGMGKMTYTRFLTFSIFAAFLWVGICVGAGHVFGQIPSVRDNFGLAALVVIGISVVPVGIEWFQRRREAKRKVA